MLQLGVSMPVAVLVALLVVATTDATPHFPKAYKHSAAKYGVAVPTPTFVRSIQCAAEVVTSIVTETQKVVQPITVNQCRTDIRTQFIKQPITTTHYITQKQLLQQHVTHTQVVTKTQLERQHVTDTKYATDTQYVTRIQPQVSYVQQRVTQFVTTTAQPQLKFVTQEVTQEVVKTQLVRHTQPVETRYLTREVTKIEPKIQYLTRQQIQYVTKTQPQISFVTRDQVETQYVTTTQVQVRHSTTPVIRYITSTQSQVTYLTQEVTKTVSQLRHVTQHVTSTKYVTQVQPTILFPTKDVIRHDTPTGIDVRCANQEAIQIQYVTKYVTHTEKGHCGAVTTIVPVQDW